MGLYKVEGIVLRRRNLGEADRLVTILSRDRGKLTVVARGARRPRSRLGGRLEPATRAVISAPSATSTRSSLRSSAVSPLSTTAAC